MKNRNRYTEDFKKQIASLHNHGKAIVELRNEFGITKSAIYNWVTLYTAKEPSAGNLVSQKEINELKFKLKRAEKECAASKEIACTKDSPMVERLSKIIEYKDKYGVNTLCNILNVRKSTFFYHLKKNNASKVKIEDDKLKKVILDIFNDSRRTFGGVKIRKIMQDKGYKITVKRIYRLMGELNLPNRKALKPKIVYPKAQKLSYAKNILDQKFYQDKPNQVWVSDFTYLCINEKKAFLCVVMDLFSRKIISHSVSYHANTELVYSAFLAAYNIRNRPFPLLFHSDQGSQYTSTLFRGILQSFHITASYSKVAYPYDNAVMESFFAFMKKEDLGFKELTSLENLKEIADDYIDFYNNKRPHGTLNLMTPTEFEENFYKTM